jgi:hypothetical protein
VTTTDLAHRIGYWVAIFYAALVTPVVVLICSFVGSATHSPWGLWTSAAVLCVLALWGEFWTLTKYYQFVEAILELRDDYS